MSFFKKLKTDLAAEERKKSGEKKLKKDQIKKEFPGTQNPEQKENTSKQESGEKERAAGKKEAQDWLKSEGQLAVDVYQNNATFCIQAPIAGIGSENIEISIEDDMLVIKGERKEPEADKEKEYFYQECYWGPFSRQIILPEDVDISKIKACLQKGILSIKIPKVTKIKKRKISIAIEN